jgi:secreted PhoX family phosphatase
MAFENSLANPGTGDRTVVVSQDDQGGDRGQVYVVRGRQEGDRLDARSSRAGLTGGTLYGIKVNGFPFESPATGSRTARASARFRSATASAKSGAQLESDSNANLVTQFQRPEDGAWDPQNANVYYFVTTDQYPGLQPALAAHVRRRRASPSSAGSIDMLLDGTEGQQMLDNITPNGR